MNEKALQTAIARARCQRRGDGGQRPPVAGRQNRYLDGCLLQQTARHKDAPVCKYTHSDYGDCAPHVERPVARRAAAVDSCAVLWAVGPHCHIDAHRSLYGQCRGGPQVLDRVRRQAVSRSGVKETVTMPARASRWLSQKVSRAEPGGPAARSARFAPFPRPPCRSADIVDSVAGSSWHKPQRAVLDCPPPSASPPARIASARLKLRTTHAFTPQPAQVALNHRNHKKL